MENESSSNVPNLHAVFNPNSLKSIAYLLNDVFFLLRYKFDTFLTSFNKIQKWKYIVFNPLFCPKVVKIVAYDGNAK